MQTQTESSSLGSRLANVARDYRRASLAELFEMRDGYVGEFGVLCGYSGDRGFLDLAAERFTGSRAASRGEFNRISLAVMLDVSNAPIRASDVPGVLHLARRPNGVPFKMLHAKVAVLSFRNEDDPSKWALRLIVSTGNWTRGTLESSYDLAFAVDFFSQDMDSEGENARQIAADLRAGWDFLETTLKYHDDSILYQGANATLLAQLKIRLKSLDKTARDYTTRLIDNRTKSLQTGLLASLRDYDVVRNSHLAIGSGFYQENSAPDEIPSVLSGLVKALRDDGRLFPEKLIVDIYVKPDACQAVAKSKKAIEEAGWTIREPAPPEYLQRQSRTLHAKFIFSCKFNTGDKNECANAWMYLGSGNLTNPGFVDKMNIAGNLECGVVIVGHQYVLSSTKEPSKVVSNTLPISFDNVSSARIVTVKPGDPFPEQRIEYIAPPIAFVTWRTIDGETFIETPATGDFTIKGIRANFLKERRAIWSLQRPIEVEIEFKFQGTLRSAFIPVIDESGLLTTLAQTPISLEDAWNRLLNFPKPPDIDDPPPEPEPDDTPMETAPPKTKTVEAKYPIRTLMRLIEQIAETQTQVREHDWSLWCARVSQTLIRAASDDIIRQFRELELNPLPCLLETHSLPTHLKTEGDRKLIAAAIERVAVAWGINQIKGLAV